jgi:hypothetical protein
MTDLGLTKGTNMDVQDRQDGIQVSFQSTIVREFCAALLIEERSLTRANWFPSCLSWSSMFVFPPPYRFLFSELRP